MSYISVINLIKIFEKFANFLSFKLYETVNKIFLKMSSPNFFEENTFRNQNLFEISIRKIVNCCKNFLTKIF